MPRLCAREDGSEKIRPSLFLHMITVLCVLRSGGIYTPIWVDRLRAGVKRHLAAAHKFVCLSDISVNCERIPLQRDWPGWWSKIEALRVPGPALLIDLDTLIIGDLSDIARQAERRELVMLRDFYRPHGLGSGVMAWNGDLSRLYVTFAEAPEMAMAEFRQGGDQSFIEVLVDLDRVTRWQDAVPGQIVSYKADLCQERAPANARVLCLHGRPKFGDMPVGSWARKEWELAA